MEEYLLRACEALSVRPSIVHLTPIYVLKNHSGYYYGPEGKIPIQRQETSLPIKDQILGFV